MITLVHNPGDYNGDGHVDDADYAVWEMAMWTGDLAADGNYDLWVSEADRDVWQSRLGTVYFGVPEPATMSLGLLLLSLAAARRVRQSIC
jgi:hypothetical protein